MGLAELVIILVTLGVSRAQGSTRRLPSPSNANILDTIRSPGPSGRTPSTDIYSALVQVNIRCSNDPTNGLSCAAEYPDQCREQWNFPNPCTRQNLDMNITKFVHPFDKTKFLMCGQLGKLYVVQCPQYEVFHDGCGQCVGEEAGLTASCEIPLPPLHNNPCTREAILANKLFFGFPGNLSRFIHCDIWGKPWERICTPGEVWSQWDVTCVLPHLLNPCNRPTTDMNYFYNHPCDPVKYLSCYSQGRAHEINCAKGEVFYETNQRCLPYGEYPDQIFTNFCENFIFGFRQYHGKGGTVIDPSRTAETINLGLVTHGGIKVAGRAASGNSIGGFSRDNRGFTIDRATRNLEGSVTFSKNRAGSQGLKANVDLRGGILNRQTDLQGVGDGTVGFDRATQVKGGTVTGQITTDGQGGVGGFLDVNRGSLSGSKSGTVDIIQPFDQSIGTIDQGFNGGVTTNLVDNRDKPLPTGPATAEFVDIPNLGTSGTQFNMIDIRETKGSGTNNKVDIRSSATDGGMVDKRGSRTTESGGIVDITGQGTGSVDGPKVDIRGGKVSATSNKVDIRGESAGGGLDFTGFQTDISHGKVSLSQGTGSITDSLVNTPGGGLAVAIPSGFATGSSVPDVAGGIIDQGGVDGGIGVSSGTMVDIRHIANDSAMVDIRGSKIDKTGFATGSSVPNVAGGIIDQGGVDGGIGVRSGNMVDIRHIANGGAMVDIRGSKIDKTGSMVDFGGFESGTGGSGGNVVDIWNAGNGGATTGGVDILGSKTDITGGALEITVQSTGAGSGGMIETQVSNLDKTGVLIDTGVFDSGIGGNGGNMVNIGNVGNGGGVVDTQSSKFDTTGGIVEIIGQSTGTDIGGMIDIPIPPGGSMEILDGTLQGGMKEIQGSQTDAFGRVIDITGQGHESSPGSTVDIRGEKVSGKKTTVDIRGSTIEGGNIDFTGSQTGLSGGAVDLTSQGIGTGGMDVNMIDIRKEKGTGTNNKVDIRGGDGMGHISGLKTEGTGSVIDIASGTGGHMADIRVESASKTKVDIRGPRQGSLDATGGMADSSGGNTSDRRGTVQGTVDSTRAGSLNFGTGVDQATWTDIKKQPGTSQTSEALRIDIRNQPGHGSVMGGGKGGLGSMTTLDLRNKLGLGEITNNRNVAATGTMRTDTITIDRTARGGQAGGTMQELLNTWNTIIGGGNSRRTIGVSQGRASGGVIKTGINQPGNGKIIDTRMTVHPSRLKMYVYSDIPFNEPCTAENIDARRTHFRFKDHPHMFLQCDTSGRMHRMPCSTTGRDWFDVYTNTCVDGPVHVDNRIQ